jgi:hypothetical protein
MKKTTVIYLEDHTSDEENVLHQIMLYVIRRTAIAVKGCRINLYVKTKKLNTNRVSLTNEMENMIPAFQDHYFQDATQCDWEKVLDTSILIETMRHLPINHQKLCWDIIVMGKSQSDLANELHKSPAAVNKMYKRCLSNLSKQLKEGLNYDSH